MQHVREPYNLGDSEYGEFSLDLEEFLGDDRSLPYRPAHLIADIASRGLAFRQKLDAMNTALATRKTASNTIKNCVVEIDRLVRWMRNILPTLSDDSILLPFGLDRKVPDGYAELKDYADTVDAHWQTVKLEPLFAPVAVRMDDLAGLIATYETARALQITADGEYDQFQNEKDIARAGFHEAERLVFNWFAAHYPDGQDMYWEQTPWGKAPGKSSGGGGEEEEPQPEEFPAWPGPTGVFTLRYWGEGVVEIVYGGVQESTIGWLHRSVPGAEDWIEVNIHLPMNEEDILPFREMHVPIGMWEYRFIPMRGVEKGVASFARIEVV
jgi:hypothetical protein